MQGFQAIPELVRLSQIPCVFGMVGGTNVPWIAQGVEAGAFRFVRTRHEETAVNAAAGWGRAAGSVGICTVTRGPGFANAVGGLVAAAQSRSPMLLIVGESPATREETAQNIDQRGLTAMVGAGFTHVAQAGELQEKFWQALAAGRRAGQPQVLSIGDAVLTGDVTIDAEAPSTLRPQDTPDH